MNKSHRSAAFGRFEPKFGRLREDIMQDPSRLAELLNLFFEEYAEFEKEIAQAIAQDVAEGNLTNSKADEMYDALGIGHLNPKNRGISRRLFLRRAGMVTAAAGGAAAGGLWLNAAGVFGRQKRIPASEALRIIREAGTAGIGCNTGLNPEEDARLASYTAKFSQEEHNPDIFNRTFDNRLQDHDILLECVFHQNPNLRKFRTLNIREIEYIEQNKPIIGELRKILIPDPSQKLFFFDIGPGIANKDTNVKGGRGKPAITSQETARFFPNMQVIALDLPSEMDRFTGLTSEKNYLVDADLREELLRIRNIHLVRGDGLKSLLEQWNDSSTNPYPSRWRPEITRTATIIIRAANSIDVYCSWKAECCPAITRMALDFKEQPVLLFFNRDILMKEAGIAKWKIIGNASPMGFNHEERILTRMGEPPFRINKNKFASIAQPMQAN